MDNCHLREDHPYTYSYYIHGYFLPWLQQLRDAGELHQGESNSITNDTASKLG